MSLTVRPGEGYRGFGAKPRGIVSYRVQGYVWSVSKELHPGLKHGGKVGEQ